MMHVLSADWLGSDLHILADHDGVLRELTWSGSIDWTVSEARRCVGRITRDGHLPCPHRADVTHDRQCSRCAPAWSDCVFEPIEHSPDDRCFLCQREHVVYLAFYGTLPKVGMTSSRRAPTRWREQGADAAFIVQRRPDRRRARETERTVSFLHGIPERRRSKELARLWTRDPDADLIAKRAAEWQEVLRERFDVEPLQAIAHDLGRLPSPPDLIPAEGRHQGTVLGAKGNLMMYQAQAGPLDVGGVPVRAFKRGDLVGRFVEL